MSLLFNMLSMLVIAVLPRSKHLLISWLQSPSAVILDHPKIKSLTVSIVSPSICHAVMGLDAMILIFWMLNFKPGFSLFSFTYIKRPFGSSLLSAIRVVSLHIWGYWYFLPALAIPLLGIYPEKNIIDKDTCTPVFTVALFTIARKWKQPRCPSRDEWMKKLWYIHTKEYY